MPSAHLKVALFDHFSEKSVGGMKVLHDSLPLPRKVTALRAKRRGVSKKRHPQKQRGIRVFSAEGIAYHERGSNPLATP